MSKKKNIVMPSAILLGVLIAVFFSLQFAERQLRGDLTLAPPMLQIRAQVKDLVIDRDRKAVADNAIGFSFPAGLVQDVTTPDFSFVRRLDSHGYPNNIDWPERAEIIVLGDSIAMAEGVGIEQGFVARINVALKEKTVINLSSPGAGLERQVRILDRYDDELEPDLIVACLLISADLENDIQFNEWLNDSLDLSFNKFRLSFSRRKGEGRFENLHHILEKRALYQWMLSKVEPRLWGARKIIHGTKMSDGQMLLFDRDKVKFASQEFSGDEVEFIHLRAAIDRIISLAARNSADLVFLLLPSKEEIFALEASPNNNSALVLVKSALNQRGVEFLDLYGELRKSASDKTPYFMRDIHFNGQGNKVIADAFINWYSQRVQNAGSPGDFTPTPLSSNR